MCHFRRSLEGPKFTGQVPKNGRPRLQLLLLKINENKISLLARFLSRGLSDSFHNRFDHKSPFILNYDALNFV